MFGARAVATARPRIFWFDADRQLSFGWSGRPTDAVSVLAHTDLSEHEFVPPADLTNLGVAEALRVFETICRTWRSPYLTKRG
jgi:hypothetical protein